MLETNTENRQSAGQVLRHPWTSRNEEAQIPLTLYEELKAAKEEKAKINCNSGITSENHTKKDTEPGNQNEVIQDNTGRQLNGWLLPPNPKDNCLNTKLLSFRDD